MSENINICSNLQQTPVDFNSSMEGHPLSLRNIDELLIENILNYSADHDRRTSNYFGSDQDPRSSQMLIKPFSVITQREEIKMNSSLQRPLAHQQNDFPFS